MRDKKLFTPGPLTTSEPVKRAMLHDLGSRDTRFIETVRRVRHRLLSLAGVSQAEGFEAVLMQGSGTFTVESVISSVIPPAGKLLVVINGAYGERIVKIAKRHHIHTTALRCPENEIPKASDVDEALESDSAITHVAVVHCETTSGIMNPIDEIGRVVRKHRRAYFVDSMSAFGGVELDVKDCQIDYLVSSANKCIEGVPGFGFVICRRESLLGTNGSARTLSLDLLEQWKGLEGNGQFRFTPPTHTILAFERALEELEEEGSVQGRSKRYAENHRCLVAGMREIGFQEYVPSDLQGHIITSFHYPSHANFDFEDFYGRLSEKGFVIYPGKLSQADCFRIGTIGRIFPEDIRQLLTAIETTLAALGVEVSPVR